MQSTGLCSFTTSLVLSNTPNFPKNPPPPSEAYQCKGAPTCPSTAYQGAKTHCIYMIWMWDAVYRGLEGPPTDKTIKKIHQHAF